MCVCHESVLMYLFLNESEFFQSVFVAASVDGSGASGGAEGSQGDEQSLAAAATMAGEP